jgi:hypothetical protein
VRPEHGWAQALFAAQNREYLDWWLLQRFPGRTLEELDNVDWLRLQRALEVGRIVDVEAKNALYLEGKLKADAFKPREWQAIQEHDRLYEAWEAEQAQRMAAQ